MTIININHTNLNNHQSNGKIISKQKLKTNFNNSHFVQHTTYINLSNSSWLRDKYLIRFKSLNCLESVDLSHCQNITFIGISHLPTSLKQLNLTKCQNDLLLTCSPLSHLSKLEELDMSSTRVSNIDVQYFPSNLTKVSFYACKRLNDDLAHSLNQFSKLKSLNMQETYITNLFLKKLQLNLEELNIRDCRIRDGVIDNIVNMSNLISLDMGWTHITSFSSSALSQSSLKYLNLEMCTFIKDFTFLNVLHHLEDLNLAGTKITDEIGNHLSQLNLKKLDISSTKISKVIFCFIQSLSLEKLYINACPSLDLITIRNEQHKFPSLEIQCQQTLEENAISVAEKNQTFLFKSR